MMVTCKKFRASHQAWREGNKGDKGNGERAGHPRKGKETGERW